MAKRQVAEGHPQELFVLSSPHHWDKKVSLWFCTSPRELLFLLVNGHGWVNTREPRIANKLAFGKLTYMHPDGVDDLSGFVAGLWQEYVTMMLEAGAEGSYSLDPANAHWTFDPFPIRDEEPKLRKAFVAAWEAKLMEHISSL